MNFSVGRNAAARMLAAALLAVAILPAGGCNRKPQRPIGKVSGRVTLEGKPLGEGCISFCVAGNGTSLMANLNDDGTYTIRSHDEPGILAGTYRVTISPKRISEGDPMRIEKPQRGVKPDTKIPKRYWDFEKSGLTADVKEGDNPPYNFDLTP